MLLGGSGIRRTADYLIFSPTPAAVNAVNLDAFADAVKGGDALVKFSADLKAVRQSMPDQYKQMLDMMSSGAGADKAATIAPILKSFETLDRFWVSLDNGEKGIRLAFTATPFKLPAVTAANKAGMPPGVLARLDYGVSIVDVYPAAKDSLASLSKSAQDDPTANKGKPFTDEQKKQIGSVLSKISTLVLEPAVNSVGVEMIAGEPVVYIAQHWSKPMDVPKEVQQLVATFNTIQKDADPTHTVELQTYQSDGAHVLRVFMDTAKPTGHLDIVQKGDDVFITFCPNAYRYIHKLMASKDEGPITAVYSAWLDLEKLAIALGAGPNAPLSGMPADKRKQLVDLLQGQKIEVSSSSEGDAASIELTVGKGLVQNAPKLAALFGLTPPPIAPVQAPPVKDPQDASKPAPDAPPGAQATIRKAAAFNKCAFTPRQL